MGSPTALLLCTSLLLITSVPGRGQEISYHFFDRVPDTDGSYLFLDNFGEGQALELMANATHLVWRILGITNFPENTNNYTEVWFILDTPSSPDNTLEPDYYAVTEDYWIVFNAERFRSFTEAGTLHDMIFSLVYHEMTHVWQSAQSLNKEDYTDQTKAIVEGTADYVTLESGHPSMDCRDYVLKEEDHWDTGYCPTALFLKHLTDVYNPNLVAQLNLRIGAERGYQANFFPDLVGADPETLWQEFIARPDGLRPVVGPAGGMLADGNGKKNRPPCFKYRR